MRFTVGLLRFHSLTLLAFVLFSIDFDKQISQEGHNHMNPQAYYVDMTLQTANSAI